METLLKSGFPIMTIKKKWKSGGKALFSATFLKIAHKKSCFLKKDYDKLKLSSRNIVARITFENGEIILKEESKFEKR